MIEQPHGVPWRPYCVALPDGMYEEFVPIGCYAQLLGYSFVYTGLGPDDTCNVSLLVAGNPLVVAGFGGESTQIQFTTLLGALADQEEAVSVFVESGGSSGFSLAATVWGTLWPREGIFQHTIP